MGIAAHLLFMPMTKKEAALIGSKAAQMIWEKRRQERIDRQIEDDLLLGLPSISSEELEEIRVPLTEAVALAHYKRGFGLRDIADKWFITEGSVLRLLRNNPTYKEIADDRLWASQSIDLPQIAEMSATHWDYNGVRMTVRQLAGISVFAQPTMKKRLKRMSVQEAVNKPKHQPVGTKKGTRRFSYQGQDLTAKELAKLRGCTETNMMRRLNKMTVEDAMSMRPRNWTRPVITPLGRHKSIEAAARAHGTNIGFINRRIRKRLRGWRYATRKEQLTEQ